MNSVYRSETGRDGCGETASDVGELIATLGAF